jgi:hypothetical protein
VLTYAELIRYQNYTTPFCRYDIAAKSAASRSVGGSGGWKVMSVQILVLSASFIGLGGIL